MRQSLLAAAFAVAGIPFSGLVIVSVLYALDKRQPASGLPDWYFWLVAAASVLVTGLFVACAARAVGYGPSWRTLFRLTAISLLPVALISAGSPELPAGLAVLLLAIWALRRRDPAEERPTTRTSRDTG